MPLESSNRKATREVAHPPKERPHILWMSRSAASVSVPEPGCGLGCYTRKKWTWALATGSKAGQCSCDWVAVVG